MGRSTKDDWFPEKMKAIRHNLLGTLLLACMYLLACNGSAKKELPVESKKEKELFLKRQTSPANSSIRGIAVIDSNTVWLSGAKGTILRTLNAGDVWELIPAPDKDSLDFRSIVSFSEKEVLIASAGFPARIYHTENAGKEWDLVYENIDSAAFINSMAFKNNKEGIAFGDLINGRHMILQTRDGGRSWEQIDTMGIPLPLKIEHGFAASGTCIAISSKGNYFIALGGEKSRVFKSTDGLNWKAFHTKMKSGTPTMGIYSMTYGRDRLMAVGGDYTLADSMHLPTFSVDEGLNWQLTEGEVGGYRSVIDYVERENAWVTAGTNGIEYSYDDGKHWISAGEVNTNTLQFDEQSGMGWLANHKGEIYKLEFRLKSQQ